LGYLNPPPQLTEFKHSSGQRGPNLEDRRKAMIAQIHLFQTHAFAKPQSHGLTHAKTIEFPAQMSVRYRTDGRFKLS
jgi:hypothetical protein